jgi:hypothetical protein
VRQCSLGAPNAKRKCISPLKFMYKLEGTCLYFSVHQICSKSLVIIISRPSSSSLFPSSLFLPSFLPSFHSSYHLFLFYICIPSFSPIVLLTTSFFFLLLSLSFYFWLLSYFGLVSHDCFLKISLTVKSV